MMKESMGDVMNRRMFFKKISILSLSLLHPKMIWSKVLSKENRMRTILHKSETRGIANHGWLNSHHTFSFANYYDPKRMGFGVLRVINDDIVAPAKGFGTHPHNNMEIISIPLAGSLKHKDTMGNEHIIAKGEVQAMSAGTGLQHSEYNSSNSETVNFLQIWLLPKKENIKPNYSQKKFDALKRRDKLQLVVSPDGREDSVEINQDAFFSLIDLSSGNELFYSQYNKENGVYFFVIDGQLDINDEELKGRDGLGIENIDEIKIVAKSKSELLIMEVPLNNARRG